MKKYVGLLTLSLLSSISFVEGKGFNPENTSDSDVQKKIVKLKQKQAIAKQEVHNFLNEQIEALSNYIENRKLPENNEEEIEFKTLMVETAINIYYTSREDRKKLLKEIKLVKDETDIISVAFGGDEFEQAMLLSRLGAEQEAAEREEKELIGMQIESLSNLIKLNKESKKSADNCINQRIMSSTLEIYYDAQEQRAHLQEKKGNNEEVRLKRKQVEEKVAPAAPAISWSELENFMGDTDDDFEENGYAWNYENGNAFGSALSGEKDYRKRAIIPSSKKAELITINSANKDIASFAKQHPEFVDKYAVAYRVDKINTPFFLVLKDK